MRRSTCHDCLHVLHAFLVGVLSVLPVLVTKTVCPTKCCKKLDATRKCDQLWCKSSRACYCSRASAKVCRKGVQLSIVELCANHLVIHMSHPLV